VTLATLFGNSKLIQFTLKIPTLKTSIMNEFTEIFKNPQIGLIAALLFFILSLACYVVYQLQVEKNKRKQHESETRKLLRNNDPDDLRDRKMIEAVRRSKEYVHQ
jgi:hypothetical protein